MRKLSSEVLTVNRPVSGKTRSQTRFSASSLNALSIYHPTWGTVQGFGEIQRSSTNKSEHTKAVQCIDSW